MGGHCLGMRWWRGYHVSVCGMLVSYGYVPQGRRRHCILVDYDVLGGRLPSELQTMLPSIACGAL